MAGKNKYDDEELLEQLRTHLIGPDADQEISAGDYERLRVKPACCTLRRRFAGYSWPQIRQRALTGETPDVLESEDVDGPVELHYKHEYRKAIRALEKQRNLNQVFIDNCLPAIEKCSFKTSKIPPVEKVTRPQDFHSMQSDFQIGERVDAEWVQGISVFNMEEMERRLNKLAERIITFKEQDKASLGLNKLVIDMLGDIVNGELIYRGQSWFTDAVLVDQLMAGTEIYIDIILLLAQYFPKIELYCVIGNHGRHGNKGDAHPRSNFDYLFYRMIQRALRPQKNVTVYVNESPTMIIDHGEFTFALNHNDSVKGWNGIPYYGLDRQARRLNGLYNMTIDYKLGGHFHTPAELNNETYLNGTVVGGNDLSINKMMVATRPSQKIFYFDPKHGIHRVTNLFLADKITMESDLNGIYTSYTE